ncbi:MAG: type II CAAX endopeptidase family protein [Anaerolineae bacterium]
MQTNSAQERQPLRFFLLVFLITLPFWLFGGHRLPLRINLPVSALAFFNPSIAAALLSYGEHGLSALKEWFRKIFDYRKITNRLWYIPVLLLMPFIYFLSYVIMRVRGLPLPDPVEVPLSATPAYFLMFFVAATAEELGWTAYATDPLQKRWGALRTGVILGLVWGLWHIIPDVQNGKAADWILWHRLYSVALRILIVWVYNNTGKSVFAASLVHTMDNVSVFLFPNYGSHYNPFITCIITWLMAALVIFGWGPRTLARYRYTRTNPS